MKELTDFTSHHIEGIAREGNVSFSVPLITHVENNLWQGGCINGVSLEGNFKHIISLYPWERFNSGGELDSFLEVKLYDSGNLPDKTQLYNIARWINECLKTGKNTLVHCQAGLNRSALVTSLALILQGRQPKDVISLLRDKRCPAVLCNKTFREWLESL